MHDELEEVPSRSVEDYWAIVHRMRRWLLLPAFLCWTLVWGVSWLLPTLYRSEAVILVEQQKVPAGHHQSHEWRPTPSGLREG